MPRMLSGDNFGIERRSARSTSSPRRSEAATVKKNGDENRSQIAGGDLGGACRACDRPGDGRGGHADPSLHHLRARCGGRLSAWIRLWTKRKSDAARAGGSAGG